MGIAKLLAREVVSFHIPTGCIRYCMLYFTILELNFIIKSGQPNSQNNILCCFNLPFLITS